MKRTDKVILPICIYLILIGLLGWFVWGHQRSFSFLLPIDFDGFGALGDFVGGIFGTLFAALAVYFAWMTFKKETIKTRFYEMLKSHRENVARIQISDIDVFGKYIAVLLEIYVTLLQKLTGKGYRDEDIFKLSYLFFFYGTELNSKTINTLLKKENEKLIDSEDVEKCMLYQWGIHLAGRKQHKKYFYAVTQQIESRGMLHRYIMDCPNDMVVDHMDGDTLNTRKYNLRVISHQQNCINRKINHNNTSGIKGVTWSKKDKKWMAYIHIDNKFKNLGYYDNIEEAGEARKRAEQQRLNDMDMK